MFQSLSRDSGRLNFATRDMTCWWTRWFQSLSRDSGRLNLSAGFGLGFGLVVSIPQSGFGAFELRH